MKSLFFFLLLSLVCVSSFQIAQGLEKNGSQATEVGLVTWQRDFSAALEESKRLNRPILALFQEVPGCHGCKAFGRDVLSDKTLVSRIEENFIPVLIYNNRGGEDAALLKQFGEPSWNFQVIRFLDHESKDIIPRRDKVWTLKETNARVDLALETYQKNFPNKSVSQTAKPLTQVAYAMHCFWTGEMELGGIDGVERTEAGYFDGHEVTRVWFDSSKISQQSLSSKAQALGLARSIYSAGQGSNFSKSYRKAGDSDQKKQLDSTIFESLEMTEFQKTKVNAFARRDPRKAVSFLTSSQRKSLRN